jgi:hypothetical protein
MRFVDFLKATVLLSAGSASTLALITVLGATRAQDNSLVLYCTGWWLAATLIGAFLGRRTHASPAITRLLADARSATMMPEIHPGAVMLNRLWPLLLATLVASGLALFAPQIAGIATGFAIIWALSWRHQDKAVLAIEERDGLTFFVERTSPLRPMRLERMPGMRREVPT